MIAHSSPGDGAGDWTTAGMQYQSIGVTPVCSEGTDGVRGGQL